MKNIFKIAAAALLVAGVFSCSNKVEYLQYAGGKGFVSMYTTDMNPLEDTVTLQVPVRYYAGKDVASTVSYKIVEGSAKAGVDYEDSGDGTLAFAAGDTLKYINITIINHPGEFTGDLTFSVDIVSATNNVNVGALNEVNVTIGDKDHPLTSLFGTYTMKAITRASGGYTYASFAMTISAYDGNPYRCWFSTIIPGCAAGYYINYMNGSTKVYGEVSKDLKTITIPLPQTLEAEAEYMFGSDVPGYFTVYGWTGTNLSSITWVEDDYNVVFTQQEDGSYTTTEPYGMTAPSYLDDWLYYYFNVLSKFNSNYPTKFVKQ